MFVCNEEKVGQNHNVKIANKSSENLDKVKALWNVTNESVLPSAD
jgi:hypothetical protein